MYYSKSIIEKIGSDKELALRLDRAVAGVRDADTLNKVIR